MDFNRAALLSAKEGFDTLRQYHGMSGFPKRAESDCDVMDTGHSSTSISAALGFVKARDICKENHKVFAVIGAHLSAQVIHSQQHLLIFFDESVLQSAYLTRHFLRRH